MKRLKLGKIDKHDTTNIVYSKINDVNYSKFFFDINYNKFFDINYSKFFDVNYNKFFDINYSKFFFCLLSKDSRHCVDFF